MERSSLPVLTIKAIAIIELSIGLITIFSLVVHPLFYLTQKPFSVMVFVLVSAAVSSVLGYGMFRRKEWARYLLVFFSGYVVITKILIFSNILVMKSEILTIFPSWSKNALSLAYHITVIGLLENNRFKSTFKTAK